jgi:prepilin-type N-terminal cleavage/methylation domain-containing protein
MKSKMWNKQGFTVVELIVVIVVIGIITAATTFAYNNVRQQSRDTQRTASATIVAENLEKYYDKNGEYPSIAKITNTNATTVKTLLGMDDVDSLIAPNAPLGSTTNIWKSGTPTTTNPLTYSANNDADPSCLTGSATADVCDDFKIQYLEESTNTTETIYSRHVAVDAPAAPAAPVVAAPGAPTISNSISGSTVTATRTSVSCRAGAITQYSFRARTNDGTWGSFGAWTTNTSTSAAVSQGVKYGFQVKAKCIEGDYSSADSPISAETTYIHPVNTPGAPTLTNSVSGNITTWSWPATACPAGTTAYYSVNRGNDIDPYGTIGWSGWTADQTATTWTRDTTSQGYNYTSVVRVKCGNTFDMSNWSAESNYSSYLRPVSAPGGASSWGYAILNSRTIYRWTWVEPACGQATSKSYQWDTYIGDVNNANGWNMYWRDKGPYYHYWYGASAPSFQDPGWYTGPVLDIDFNGASTPGGVDVYARIKYRCQNPVTLRTAEGGWAQSPNNWT